MGDFCCKVKASYFDGQMSNRVENARLKIDQRTKVEHLQQHADKKKEKGMTTIWTLRPNERKDIAQYQELATYFADRERVGLVQATTFHYYLVPTEKFLPLVKNIISSEEKAAELPSAVQFLLLQVPAPSQKKDK